MSRWTIFFLCLVALFMLGVLLALRARLRYPQCIRIRAKVIEVRVAPGYTVGQVHRPGGEFFTVEFKDHRGRLRRVHLSEASPNLQGTDGKVAVFYHPSDSSKVWLDAFTPRYLVAFICMAPAVLLVLLLVGVKIYLMLESR